MEDLLRKLDFDHEDAAALLRSRAQPADLIERRRASLVAAMGEREPRPTWEFDDAHPWATTWPFLAAVGDVRAYHGERGIPADVSWASLRDLGRHARIDRELHGTPGLRKAWWLMLHFRGLLYELGRLQFELLSDDELGVHIPATGPLDPAACDESIARAVALFSPTALVCESWLLDPALEEYLPADSNIVRFRRRFELLTDGEPADASVVEFVYGRLDANPDELPQRTTLERAIVRHLRAGRHWVAPIGRLAR